MSDVGTPGILTNVIAFVRRHEPNLRKSDLCFIAAFCYVKNNVVPGPLGFILYKTKIVLQHMPDDLLARDEFGNLKGDQMSILIMVIKDAEFIGITNDIL